MGMLKRLANAAAALATLVAIGAGLPAALVQWGSWPINGLPTANHVRDLPSTIVTDSSLFGILTVVTWIVWVGFLASVVIELVASFNGKPGLELPFFGPLQRMVRPLVASLVMSVSAAGSLASPPAGGLTSNRPATALVQLIPSVQPVSNVSPATPLDSASPVPTDLRTVEVGPSDTYWEIAERILGEGLRWSEVRDANIGRLMPDGHVIDASSELLRPGWVLVIPSSGHDVDAPEVVAEDAGSAGPAGAEVVAQHGDSLWSLAESHLAEHLGRSPTTDEIADFCRTFIEVNRDRLADPGNPDLIYAGQTFRLPQYLGASPTPSAAPPASEPPPSEAPPGSPQGSATPATTPTTSPQTSTPTSSPQSSPTTAPPTSVTPQTTVEPGSPATPTPTSRSRSPHPGADDRQNPAESDTEDADLPVEAVAGIASVMLAVGVTLAIRRRRRQRNHLAPTSLPLPSADEEFHRDLLVAADETEVESLGAALDTLAGGLAKSGQPCRPLIVQHGAGHTDVLLDRPTAPAIPGWETFDDGSLWTREAGALAPGSAQRLMSPAPLLVSLGRPERQGQLYIDLEAACLVTLIGEPECRLDLLRTFAVELAHAHLAETTQIYVVGDLGVDDLLAECEQITRFDSWTQVLGDLAASTERARSALAGIGHNNAFIARSEDLHDDALVPLVVLAAEAPEPDDAISFLRTNPGTSAVAVIADQPLPDSIIVECSPGELHLPQLDLTCIPQALDEGELGRIAVLLRSASDPAGLQLALTLDLPEENEDSLSGLESEPPTLYQDPPYEVLVRFLGDVSAEGVFRRPLKAKELAALAFIALRGPVTVDRAEDALWAAPTTDTRRRRLVKTMSSCRSAIGPEHLPNAQDGYYTVGPAVTTDLALFEARVEAASQEPHRATAADLLLSALSLCTGEVFHTQSVDRDSFAWIEAGNFVSHWEIRVTELAQKLAEDCIDHDDARRAIEACETGLRVMPTHTGCTEALMCAHAANGDLAAVQHVYQAHVASLELIHLDTVAESTADLYERLMA